MVMASRNPPIMQHLVPVPRGLAEIASPVYHEPPTQLIQHHDSRLLMKAWLVSWVN